MLGANRATSGYHVPGPPCFSPFVHSIRLVRDSLSNLLVTAFLLVVLPSSDDILMSYSIITPGEVDYPR